MEQTTCTTRLRLSKYFKIKPLILSTLFIYSHFLIGQITITSSTFPVAGDKLRYVQAANSNAAIALFTPPGSNQNWDLSALTTATTFETNYRPATEGANAAAFPSATMVVKKGTDEFYYRSSGTKFELLGQASSTVGGVTLKALYINQPPIIERHAPLSFFDIYAQSSGNLLSWAFNEIPNGALNLPVTPDSIRLRINKNIVEVVDATGTLTLPGALPQSQFPVLRLKKTTYHEQRIDAKIPPLGWLDVTDNVVSGGTTWASLFGVDTTVTHHYFNNIAKEEIAVLTFNSAQNQVISVVYKNTASALPIELLSFKGKNIDIRNPATGGTEGVNLLTWTTANETNNKGFQIERKQAIGDSWEALDFVKGNGMASTYNYTDKNPLSTSYYRLRQIDNDGKETLSNVVSVSSDKTKGKLKVYPNPVSNILIFETDNVGNYQVINLLGQQVISGKAAQQIDVVALAKGAYFLRVSTEQVSFVKQ
jgi:hypothetical protein